MIQRNQFDLRFVLSRCPTAADAAAVNIAQMTFLATTMNILSIVANINNNLNNNNNNVSLD